MQFLLYFILVTSFNYAQFDWDENGIPVRQGYHIEWYRGGDISSDGSMLVVWSDTRTSTRDVYAQSVDANGNIRWDTNGVLIAGGESRQEDPIIISDNSGGGFISWRSYINDPIYGELYVQRIDSDGGLLWATEKLISGNIKVRSQSQQNMCSDRQGGVYVTWYEDAFAGDGNYYGTHLQADGTFVGPDLLIETDENYGSVSLESAGGGDAVLAWKEGNNGSENIYAQRIKAVNTTIDKLWNAGNPVEVCTSSGSQLSPKVTYYSDEYVVIVWDDQRTIPYAVGGNFINVNGVLTFASGNDLVFTTTASSSTFPRVKATSEGAFVVWLSAENVFYVQKMIPENISVWTDPVSLGTGQNQAQARLSSDGLGGVFISWEDDQTIAVQHLASNGFSSFSIILSDTASEQFYTLVRSDGASGAYIVWADGYLGENGIGSLGLHYEYVDLNGSTLGSPVELFYGYGGLIDKGTTRSIPFDEDNNLIYWQDYRNGANNPQTYGSLGGKTANFGEIKRLSNYSYQKSPQIVRADQSTLFMGFYNEDEKVYYQLLNNSLETIGEATSVNDTGNQQASDDAKPLLLSTETDGFGVVYYAYTEFQNDGNIYLQKYDAGGTSLWSAPQQITNTTGGDNIVRGIFATKDGGCILFYDLQDWPDYNVQLTRIDENGNIVSNWDNSIISQYGEKGYYEDAIATDEGIFVTWRDNGQNIFGKNIPFDSENPSSLAIVTMSSTGSLYTESLSIDYNPESNEVLSCWQENIGSVYNIHCVSIRLDNLTVSSNIIEVYENPSNGQKNPSIKATDHSTYSVSWEDERGGTYSDLYIQEINSCGDQTGFFGSEGTILCNADFHQYNRGFEVITGEDIFISYWEDDRSSGKETVNNIYAQKMTIPHWVTGDINNDNLWNIQDIVQLANCILANSCGDISGSHVTDFNRDCLTNVQDIVQLANCVLANTCGD